MDTTALDTAYGNLLDAATALAPPYPLGDAERAEVDWRLVHIALSDRIIGVAAADVLAGRPAVVDNLSAMDRETIAQTIAVTTHLERVETIRRHATALLDTNARMPEDAVASLVELRMHDREGRHVSDTTMSWGELMGLRAERHLPGHTTQFAAFAGQG